MEIINFRKKYRDLELAHGYDLYNSEVLNDLLNEVMEEYEHLVRYCLSLYPEGVGFNNAPKEHWIDPFTGEPYSYVTEEYINKWSSKND